MAFTNTRLLLAALLLFALIGFGGLNPYLAGGGDNAEYLAQAEALVALGHRANLCEYGAPAEHLKPPLFPVLLAPFVAAAGRNILLLKAVIVLFGLAAVWAAWWALSAALEGAAPEPAERDEPSRAPQPAAFLALWFALAPPLGLYAHDLLSDVPFTFVALLCFGLAARAVRPPPSRTSGLWLAAALVVCLAAGAALRSAGVLVAGASTAFVLVETAARRRQPQRARLAALAGLLLVVTLGLLLWQQYLARGYVTPGQFIEGFLRPASTVPENVPTVPESLGARLARLALFYALSLPGGVAVHSGFAPYHPVPILGGLVALVGAVALLRRGQRLVPVCWACYQAPLLLLPFQDLRYNLPAFPLYLALLWAGGKTLLESAARCSRFCGALAMFVLILCSTVSLLGVLLGFGELEPVTTTPYEWLCGVLLAALLSAWAAFGSPRTAAEQDGQAAQDSVPSCPACLAFRARRLALATSALLLALALSRSAGENLVREHCWGPAPPGPGWQGFHDAAEWLKQHAAPGDAVVSARPSLVWFWSGLPGLYISKTTDPAAADRALAPARWVIRDAIGEDDPAGKFLDPYLQARQAEWEVVWRAPALDPEGQTVGWTFVLHRRP